MITVKSKGLRSVRRQLLQLPGVDFAAELMDSVGALVESQTRRRIHEQETAPSGESWTLWSEGYAASRHAGHSLLQGEGDLLDSIQFLVDGDTVEVGSNLVYAASHQYGDPERGIPARPFLGLSDEDEAELDDLVQEFAQHLSPDNS